MTNADFMIHQLLTALRDIAEELECGGPTCYYCDSGTEHPHTQGAKTAKAALVHWEKEGKENL